MTLQEAITASQAKDVYLSVGHNGVVRDVVPYEIKQGKFWLFCLNHYSTESWWLEDTSQWVVTDREIEWDMLPISGY